jgi:hypothetical protein
VSSALGPTVTGTNTISAQKVDRTERIFVHSLSSRPPHRAGSDPPLAADRYPEVNEGMA